MNLKVASGDSTVGKTLENARTRSAPRMSLRALSAASGVPLTTLHRLIRDEVERPDPRHLNVLACVLGIAPAELIALAGYPLDIGSAQLDQLLIKEFGLPRHAIPAARDAIKKVANRYTATKNPGEHT